MEDLRDIAALKLHLRKLHGFPICLQELLHGSTLEILGNDVYFFGTIHNSSEFAKIAFFAGYILPQKQLKLDVFFLWGSKFSQSRHQAGGCQDAELIGVAAAAEEDPYWLKTQLFNFWGFS